MALLPLATVGDLAAWVGQPILDADARAEAVLSAASAIVRAYAGQTWMVDPAVLGDVPDDVSAVTVQIAARVWMNPSGLESVSIDDATRRWGSGGSAGLRLTETEKAILDAYRDGPSADIGTISITADGNTSTNTIYVPTGPPPSGSPFPWYSADEMS